MTTLHIICALIGSHIVAFGAGVALHAWVAKKLIVVANNVSTPAGTTPSPKA
jgi:hypothetical protein